MKAKCDNCGEKTKFQYSTLFGEVVLCEECKKLHNEDDTDEPQRKITWEDLNVEGDIEDIPDAVKEAILELIEEEGLDPEAGHVMAVSASELLNSDNYDETSKQMTMLAARGMFLEAIKHMVFTFHTLKHAGVDEDELILLIRRWTSIQYEILTDYLFYGMDHSSHHEEDLLEMNIKFGVKCDHHDNPEGEENADND